LILFAVLSRSLIFPKYLARLLLMVLAGPFIIRRLVARRNRVTMVTEFGTRQERGM
jgi:hypothetical protein